MRQLRCTGISIRSRVAKFGNQRVGFQPENRKFMLTSRLVPNCWSCWIIMPERQIVGDPAFQPSANADRLVAMPAGAAVDVHAGVGAEPAGLRGDRAAEFEVAAGQRLLRIAPVRGTRSGCRSRTDPAPLPASERSDRRWCRGYIRWPEVPPVPERLNADARLADNGCSTPTDRVPIAVHAEQAVQVRAVMAEQAAEIAADVLLLS